METLKEIEAEFYRFRLKSVSRRHLYRLLGEAGIKPAGRRTRPQTFPKGSGRKLVAWSLGTTEDQLLPL